MSNARDPDLDRSSSSTNRTVALLLLMRQAQRLSSWAEQCLSPVSSGASRPRGHARTGELHLDHPLARSWLLRDPGMPLAGCQDEMDDRSRDDMSTVERI
jgi:hypothetical protein